MSLSVAQVTRLCGIDANTARTILDALVEAKFLCVKANGAYGRLTADSGYRRMAQAHLQGEEIRVRRAW